MVKFGITPPPPNGGGFFSKFPLSRYEVDKVQTEGDYAAQFAIAENLVKIPCLLYLQYRVY